MDNIYLKWAFSAATLLLKYKKQKIKDYNFKLKKHVKTRVLEINSHKLGRAVYYIRKNKSRFVPL
jgi:hypothetical protein